MGYHLFISPIRCSCQAYTLEFSLLHSIVHIYPVTRELLPAPTYSSRMNELRIRTQLHSRYQVLDASGQLPFSIVFGLCRRSTADVDPRSLMLDIAGSVLDVRYALAHGLLTLQQQDSEATNRWVEVDLRRVTKIVAKEGEYLLLPSPVNKIEHWRDAFTVYHCPLDVNGSLASILEPGMKYRIRLASQDLGVKRCSYYNQDQSVGSVQTSILDPEVKLVSSKPTAGNATFTVVKSLSWPPKLETRIHLCASFSTPNAELTKTESSRSTALEVSVVNLGSDPVTVQTRGPQHFLKPWGLFQPEPDVEDDRMRIIDARPHKSPTSSLQVVDSATMKVVLGNEQRGTGPLMDFHANRRPKVEDLVTLMPGVPVIRKIDVESLVDGLGDGYYKIRMKPRGCRWWHGDVEKEEDDGGRMPEHLSGTMIPPLMLESQDEVDFRIRDGKIDLDT